MCTIGSMDKLDNYLNTEEAAKILGVTSRYVSELCLKGKLHCKRPARDWLVSVAEVEAYKIKPKDKGGRPKKLAE